MTLASGLAGHGAQCCFICRKISDSLAALLANAGFELRRLQAGTSELSSISDAINDKWLVVSQAEDARQTILAFEGEQCDWLIVDHYALDFNWESKLRASASHILTIDDLADRRHDCDILLDQNLYSNPRSRYYEKVPNGCRLLLGPRYALLREQFLRARQRVCARSGAVRKVMVFYGGVDLTNRTGFAIEELSQVDISGAEVDVVIGADHPNRTEIETTCGVRGFALHVQTNRMADLMAAADLGIGAGGSATWERCCLGLPTVVSAVASNQEKLVRDCALAGVLYPVDLDGVQCRRLATHLKAFIDNPLLREAISLRGMEVVDGNGTRRVMRAMGLVPVAIRRATIADSKKLFEWRNHPTTREASRSAAPLQWDIHAHWLEAALTDPSKDLLIGETSERPVGVVRFDILNDVAEVSIYAVFEATQETGLNDIGGKSLGVGADLLAAAELWLSQNRRGVRAINAEVLRENQASHRLFQSAGYERDSANYTKRIW
jgi:UDP-2,4-diacetamido-2,4,6-trideoxy-beta-L-altropyranose hydrolase